MLGLDEELDLADTTAPQFQISPRRLQPFARLIGMDLFLDRLDIQHGLIIEATAPNKGLEMVKKHLARRHITGTDAGLDKGGTLPVLADAFIIGQRHRGRHHRRCRGRIGTQSQVHAEHIALARPLGQQGRHALCQTVAEVLHLHAVIQYRRQHIGVIKQAEIDIGRIIQFKRTALAHGQRKQAGHRAARIISVRQQLAASAPV